MRLKNAIVKTFFSHGSFRLKPNPDHHRTNDSSAIELTADEKSCAQATDDPLAPMHRVAVTSFGHLFVHLDFGLAFAIAGSGTYLALCFLGAWGRAAHPSCVFTQKYAEKIY